MMACIPRWTISGVGAVFVCMLGACASTTTKHTMDTSRVDATDEVGRAAPSPALGGTDALADNVIAVVARTDDSTDGSMTREVAGLEGDDADDVATRVERAAACLGVPIPQATASRRRFDDRLVPFLTPRLVGAMFWEVRAAGVWFSLEQPIERRVGPYRVSIALSDDGESLMWIRCRREALDPALARSLEEWPVPPHDVAAQRIGWSNREKWHSLLPHRPRTDFAHALRAIARDFRGTDDAAELWAYCVLWSDLQHDSVGMWSIEERGTVPVQVGSPGGDGRDVIALESPHLVNHLRHLVFDGSGVWYGAGTSPQPDRKVLGGPLP